MKRGSGPITLGAARVGRNGLLFPDAAPRKTSRAPMLFAGIAIGAGAVWFLSRGPSVPEPAVIMLPRPTAAATPAVTAAASATAPRASDAAPPQSWEALVASRAAARASEPPAPAPAPAASRNDDSERRPTRRETARRREAPAPRVVEPAPVAVAPPSENAAPGRLNASSTPWGQLIVDGRMYGNTPRLNLPIAVGLRRIRIARDGFAPFDTTITVEPGEVVRITGITLREQP